MNQNDTQQLRQARIDLQTALDDLEELHSIRQRDGVTVDDAELTGAQEDAKDALTQLLAVADGMVDTTGEYETRDGTSIDLPNPALERSQASDLPELPDV